MQRTLRDSILNLIYNFLSNFCHLVALNDLAGGHLCSDLSIFPVINGIVAINADRKYSIKLSIAKTQELTRG
jgi:hypothetical protein